MAGQIFATNSLGGFLYSNQLSSELRTAVQPRTKFRQFSDIKDAAGKNKGQTFTWDVVSNVATKGTTLVETNTMPESQFTITQGTLTVNEAGNSIPYSGKLEDLGQIPVRKPVMQALRNDAVKTFDSLAHAQFKNTLLRIVPTAGTSTTALTLTTDGTATLTNNIAFGLNHAKLVVDLMKERNIPAYEMDDYMAIAWPSTLRTLKNNLEAVWQYTQEGFAKLYAGEIGRYDNIRYVEQTHIPQGGAEDSTTWNPYTDTADAWDNGLSDWIYFFGEDTVAEGIVVPEEIRAKIPTDYGRSKGVAWYALLGFGIVHNTAAQSRIVMWNSAV